MPKLFIEQVSKTFTCLEAVNSERVISAACDNFVFLDMEAQNCSIMLGSKLHVVYWAGEPVVVELCMVAEIHFLINFAYF